jgi:hypothetical protein
LGAMPRSLLNMIKAFCFAAFRQHKLAFTT